VGSLPTDTFLEFDVSDNNNDWAGIGNPEPGLLTTKLGIEGAKLQVKVSEEDGGVSANKVVKILNADELNGALASIAFTNSDADDWDTTNLATDGTIKAKVDILKGGGGGIPGDIDGDDDVDTADLNVVITNWTGAQAGNQSDGADADLIYYQATGEVVLDGSDTETGLVKSFVLINDAGMMNPVHDPWTFPYQNLGFNTDNLPKQIGQADLVGPGVARVELGPILPPGLDEAQLYAFFSKADYASRLGAGGVLDLIHIPVPEPGTLALISLGLVGLMRTIRRRRNG
jgi:hypothetical protein